MSQRLLPPSLQDGQVDGRTDDGTMTPLGPARLLLLCLLFQEQSIQLLQPLLQQGFHILAGCPVGREGPACCGPHTPGGPPRSGKAAVTELDCPPELL